METRKRKKVYANAPLPFQGQKRLWKLEFQKVIAELPDDTIIVDLFGGSGLLSRFAKDANPALKVVYNDFDGYTYRLKRIDETNSIISEIRDVCSDMPRNKKLDDEQKERVRDILKAAYKHYGWIDHYTISRSIVFSSKAVSSLNELLRQNYYCNVVRNPYSAEGYLDGLTIVHKDYTQLLDQYKDDPMAVFLVDPPYFGTDISTYMGEDSGLKWNIKLQHNLNNLRFIFFTNEKAEVLPLFQTIHSVQEEDMDIRKKSYCIGTRDQKGQKDKVNKIMEDIMIVYLDNNRHKGNNRVFRRIKSFLMGLFGAKAKGAGTQK